MSQEVVGNINVHQMNERRTHVQMHNIYREPTHTHTHTDAHIQIIIVW